MSKPSSEANKSFAEALRRRTKQTQHHRGLVSLRIAGKKTHPILQFTIPASISRELADQYESRQKYSCALEKDGRVVFTPLRGS